LSLDGGGDVPGSGNQAEGGTSGFGTHLNIAAFPGEHLNRFSVLPDEFVTMSHYQDFAVWGEPFRNSRKDDGFSESCGGYADR
jgi:hypothetical protein